MLYPVYVHKDKKSAFGATIPDFPGCFSAADDWNDLPTKVQEAVELHCEGEEFEIPAPSSIDKLKGSQYRGGQWIFVDIDTSRLNGKVVRLNITLKQALLNKLDRVVREVGVTRSGFLADAVAEKLARLEVRKK